MSDNLLESLQQLDSTVLTDLVRQDQRNPSFEILDWKVEPVSHEKVIDVTGGLFRFSGYGRAGSETNPWAIVLKVLNKPADFCLDPPEWCYWKRELLAFQSGILAALPNSVHAPRCYGVTEQESGGWVWLENIVETVDRVWQLDHYHLAARKMGQYAAAYIDGTTSIPDHPWLTQFFRSNQAEGSFFEMMMNPASPEGVWNHPRVQGAFVEPLRSQILALVSERFRVFDTFDRLPQVFCHNDLHRRNLMMRDDSNGEKQLVVLDWAFCGPGALGADMGELVATSLYFFEVETEQAVELETAVLDGYLAGLRDAGWNGDTRLPRLGYLMSASLWLGLSLPFWTMLMLGDNEVVNLIATYGRPAEAILPAWVRQNELWMERADEARHLIKALGIL